MRVVVGVGVLFVGVGVGVASAGPLDKSAFTATPAELVAEAKAAPAGDAAAVALLRKAGIRADVVVLDSGAGFDFDHDLPGMVFDHAIVRAIAGGKDVWIDATEDLLPAGQLPGRDQRPPMCPSPKH